jgi:hypothetical protein
MVLRIYGKCRWTIINGVKGHKKAAILFGVWQSKLERKVKESRLVDSQFKKSLDPKKTIFTEVEEIMLDEYIKRMEES